MKVSLNTPTENTFSDNPGKIDFNDLEPEAIRERFNRPVSLEDDGSENWPRLHNDALHGWFGDLVRAATEHSEADPAAVLLTALTAVGAMFGPATVLKMGEFSHPPRLFAVLVGKTSRARKGTSALPVERIIEKSGDFVGSSFPLLNMSPGPLSSGEGLVYAVRDPSEDTKDDGSPCDAGVSDKRLFVLDGEFSNSLKAMERTGNTLSPILRGAWDKGNICPLTKNNRIQATGAHLCFVSHITRFELEKLLSVSDQNNGLANRVLWGMCRRPKLVSRPKAIPDNVVNDLAKRLVDAARLAHQGGELEFSAAAMEYWDRLYPVLTKDLPGMVGAVTSRAEAQVPRLALIYALTDRADEIAPDHLQAAVAAWGYCLDSANYLFSSIVVDRNRQRILDGLNTTNEGLSQTDIRRQIFQGHIKSEKLKSLLREMEDDGEISRRSVSTGGRAKTVWQRKKRIKHKKRSDGALSHEIMCALSAQKDRERKPDELNAHLMRKEKDTQATDFTNNTHKTLKKQGNWVEV